MNKKILPVTLAIIAGLAAMIWYIYSGQATMDKTIRELDQDENVETVQAPDSKTVKITCKNGESYEIIFTKNQDDYSDLVFNACGPDGVM